jgi:membrane-associated HD superfamily phosphohydrolase
MAEKSNSKIFDKLLELIETVARIDTKVEEMCEKHIKDLEQTEHMSRENKDKVEKLQEEINTLKLDSEKAISDLKTEFLKLKLSNDKMKWIWGALAIVVVPIITTLIVLAIHALIGF